MNKKSSKRNKKRSPLGIIILLVVILVALFFGYMYFTENTNGNLPSKDTPTTYSFTKDISMTDYFSYLAGQKSGVQVCPTNNIDTSLYNLNIYEVRGAGYKGDGSADSLIRCVYTKK